MKPADRWLWASILFFAVSTSGISYPDNTPPKGVDVWCGKAYRATDKAFPDLVEAGWQHPPPPSREPLLEFSCRPRLKPYVQGLSPRPRLLFDAKSSHDVGSPLPNATAPQRVWVTASIGSVSLGWGYVELGSQLEIHAAGLEELATRTEAYTVNCAAAVAPAEVPFASATAELFWLPGNPYGGSTVQLDTKTDELVSPSFHGQKVFPIGYYTTWGNYLAGNWSVLEDIKKAGFTMVHPIPGGGPASVAWGDEPDSLERFYRFMDRAHEVGLWVMYDMRHTFASPEDLEVQVKMFRGHPALLLWYTADEPDGHNDPTNSTLLAYNTISVLDGYHPVSFTPNCQNYFFTQYASGADIVIPDIYPVGLNATFSNVYNTPCNRTYGCCGCDNCPGSLQDLGTRILEMKEYTRWEGTHKAFWGVSQAFGNSEFWTRTPTRAEMVEMSRDAVVRAKAKGLLYWSAPTTREIWEGTADVAKWVNGYTSEPMILGKEEVEGKETIRSEL